MAVCGRRCLPVKMENGGSGLEAVRVLLIGASAGGKLVLPKGGWETDETVEAAARRETMEEAGVRGDIEVPAPRPVRLHCPANCRGCSRPVPVCHTDHPDCAGSPPQTDLQHCHPIAFCAAAASLCRPSLKWPPAGGCAT